MKISILSRGVLGLGALGVVLAGCGSAGESADGTSSGDGPSIAAGFYPLAFVAERVAGDGARVHNLTQPGAEAHDSELTAQQVGLISDADLIVYVEGFQPSVDDAVAQNASGSVIDATEILQHMLDAPEASDEHDGHDHSDLEGDPHFWLDPTNLMTVTTAIADELAQADPDKADTYTTNAEQLTAQLAELDQEFSSGLAQCERSLVVVSHEAFGYLTDRYGLEQFGVAGLDPDSEPSPSRVAAVHDRIAEEGVTTIFHERLTSPDVVKEIANDLGLTTAVLDPIEGLTDETADEDYFSLMRQNLEALRAANDCA